MSRRALDLEENYPVFYIVTHQERERLNAARQRLDWPDVELYEIPDELIERYELALLEWESVQDQLEKIWREENPS